MFSAPCSASDAHPRQLAKAQAVSYTSGILSREHLLMMTSLLKRWFVFPFCLPGAAAFPSDLDDSLALAQCVPGSQHGGA